MAELEAMNSRFSLDAVRQAELVEGQGVVEFIAPREVALGLRAQDVEKALQKAAGRPVRTKITLTEAPAAAVPASANAAGSGTGAGAEEAEKRAMEHPDVQKFRELFPESKVRTVRNLKE
jgi:ribosomal protein L12E/L44/L45/RPP1/RPP2